MEQVTALAPALVPEPGGEPVDDAAPRLADAPTRPEGDG
jgi:hypothetical protein